MEQFCTKRGKITFTSGKILMEESIRDYFINMYRGLWVKGGKMEKLLFTLSVGLLSFSLTFTASVFLKAPLYLKMSATSFFLALILAVLLYEYWHNIEKEKFIEYSDIESVKFVGGLKLFTSPIFIIKYSRDGAGKKRYVTMPMRFIPGVDEDIDSIKNSFSEHDIEVK